MSESKTPRSDEANKEWAGNCHPCCVDADFARSLELELNEAKQTLPLNSKLRLIDLVRYARQTLHQEDLITDEEYTELCSITESPKRLMEYDQLRSQLTTAQQEIAELKRDKERLTHLFSEAFLPPVGKDYVVPSGTVVMCVASDVPLDEEGYRQAIDSAMKGPCSK